MSIYSGFGTRQQETFYNKITLRAMEMMSDRIISLLRSDPFDEESWYYHLRKICKYMEILEAKKYLPPKFSTGLNKLMSHYKRHLKLPEGSNSTLTSRSFFLNKEMKELNLTHGVFTDSSYKHRAESNNNIQIKNQDLGPTMPNSDNDKNFINQEDHNANLGNLFSRYFSQLFYKIYVKVI